MGKLCSTHSTVSIVVIAVSNMQKEAIRGHFLCTKLQTIIFTVCIVLHRGHSMLRNSYLHILKRMDLAIRQCFLGSSVGKESTGKVYFFLL